MHNILQKLNNDLFLKLEKCQFHQKEVEYLGVIVGNGQVKMDLVKVQGISKWPIPTTVRELHSFLGFGNYYKDFIANYSWIVHPLHELTKKTVQWHWDQPQQVAFNMLKEAFMSYPVLRNPDPNKHYILDTDALAYAIGTTLSQDFPDRHHLVAYFSKSLLLAKCNYNIYDQELLAIIYVLKAFWYLLLNVPQQFLIQSDHNNLKYFKSLQKITAQQACWQQYLQDYNFELVYFLGKSNTITNLLSRKKNFEKEVNINENVTLLPENLFAKKVFLKNNPETHCKILHNAHDIPMAGHPGISNTWNIIKRQYKGPKLY